VDLRAGLDMCGKSYPPPGIDPRTVLPIGIRNNDYATRPKEGEIKKTKEMQEREGRVNITRKIAGDFWKEEIRKFRPHIEQLSYQSYRTFFAIRFPDSSKMKISDFHVCVETDHILLNSSLRMSSESSVLVVCANDTDTAHSLF